MKKSFMYFSCRFFCSILIFSLLCSSFSSQSEKNIPFEVKTSPATEQGLAPAEAEVSVLSSGNESQKRTDCFIVPSLLTIQGAIECAIERAFALQAARTEIYKAKEQLSEAKGNLGPKFKVGASFTRFDQAITASFPGSAGSTSPFTIRPNSSQNISLSMSWPVDLVGINRRMVAAGKANEVSKVYLYFSTVSQIKKRTCDAYYEVLKAVDFLQVAKDTLKNAQVRFERAKNQLKEGAASEFLVLRFETDLEKAKAGFISAENKVKVAKFNLMNTIGCQITSEFQTVPLDALPELPKMDFQYWVCEGLSKRREIKSAEEDIKVQKELKRFAWATLTPSFLLSSKYDHNLSASGFGNTSNSAAVTAELAIPLYDTGATKAKVNQAKESLNQARIKLNEVKLGVEREICEALVRLKNADEQLSVAKKNVDLANRSLEIAEVRFKAGVGIQLEMLDAQAEQTSAKNTYVNAYYEYLSAYTEFERVIGWEEKEFNDNFFKQGR